MMDSGRVISSDRNDTLYIWLADNGHLLHTYSGPSKCVRVTNNMKYAVRLSRVELTAGDKYKFPAVNKARGNPFALCSPEGSL